MREGILDAPYEEIEMSPIYCALVERSKKAGPTTCPKATSGTEDNK